MVESGFLEEPELTVFSRPLRSSKLLTTPLSALDQVSISSTLNTCIFCTNVFFPVTFWLWTNFCTKKIRSFNVDEIDGRSQNGGTPDGSLCCCPVYFTGDGPRRFFLNHKRLHSNRPGLRFHDCRFVATSDFKFTLILKKTKGQLVWFLLT